MISELRILQASTGAILETSATAQQIPLSFGNDQQAITATRATVGLYDRSHWGLLKITGEDRLRFLHNQSTNSIQTLKSGQGCDTVFVTSTGRTIDLVTALITQDAVLVLVSPNRCQFLMNWLERYIFPMDQIQLQDITTDTSVFNLIGPNSSELLAQLGIIAPHNQPYASHDTINIEGASIQLSVGSGLASPGYTLIVPASSAPLIWKRLTNFGAIPMGEQVWEHLRILAGRPKPDAELTEDYNPLEAGLWQTLSFDKGCYIGQETIARLNTYKGVKQQLWGIRLTTSATPGSIIFKDEEKVGHLTSYTDVEGKCFGLGYIRSKAGGIGLKVKVDDAQGEVVDVPFLQHPPFLAKSVGKNEESQT